MMNRVAVSQAHVVRGAVSVIKEESYLQTLQTAMEQKGITVRDLASALGTTYEYTRIMLKGQRLPSNSTLKAMSTLLGLDYDQLSRELRLHRFKLSTKDVASFLPADLREVAERWEALSNTQKEFISKTVAEWSAKKQ